MKEMYLLAHITTSKIADIIMSTKEFKKSIHTNDTNQWLGDGVYFWDNNDKDINDLGKIMVENKPEIDKEPISKIAVLVEVDENNHLNLDKDNDARAFEEYIELIAIDELIDMLKLYKSKDRVTQSEKNKLGKIFGRCINSFQEYIENEGKHTIDIVSYTFYSGTKRKRLFSKEELNNRQFCVKNLELINGLDDNKYYCNII